MQLKSYIGYDFGQPIIHEDHGYLSYGETPPLTGVLYLSKFAFGIKEIKDNRAYFNSGIISAGFKTASISESNVPIIGNVFAMLKIDLSGNLFGEWMSASAVPSSIGSLIYIPIYEFKDGFLYRVHHLGSVVLR